MEIRTTSDAYNLLLRRKEVSFVVDHASSSTPRLYDVRKAIAVKFGAKEDIVFVRSLRTLTGTTRAIGDAEIYDSAEDAKMLVQSYVIDRNLVERHKSKVSSQMEEKSPPKQGKQPSGKAQRK